MSQETRSKCNSTHTRFNQDYGFWRCDECGETWAYAEDDPDYEELEDWMLTSVPTTDQN